MIKWEKGEYINKSTGRLYHLFFQNLRFDLETIDYVWALTCDKLAIDSEPMCSIDTDLEKAQFITLAWIVEELKGRSVMYLEMAENLARKIGEDLNVSTGN